MSIDQREKKEHRNRFKKEKDRDSNVEIETDLLVTIATRGMCQYQMPPSGLQSKVHKHHIMTRNEEFFNIAGNMTI